MEPFRAVMSYEVSRTCNSYCTSDMQLSQNFSWLEAIQVADMSYNLNIQDYEKIDEVERKKIFFFFKKSLPESAYLCLFGYGICTAPILLSHEWITRIKVN